MAVVVTAPDGTEFTDAKSYKKYLFNNYFSWKGKANEKLEKFPGEINGQEFQIQDCVDCEILVLDHLDRAVVTNLERCKIFFGPCSESVVMRQLKDCEITISCKDLRLNDCENCIVNIFSPAGVFLETCHSIKVGKFNGAYCGLGYHFDQASLTPNSETPKVTDFSKKDDTLPKPHFEMLPNASPSWAVELQGATGLPENPVFPDESVQPQTPPPPVNPPPDLNPSFDAPAPQVGDVNEAAEYDFVDEANSAPQMSYSAPQSDMNMNGEMNLNSEPEQVTTALDEWKVKFEESCKEKDKQNQEKRNLMKEKAEEELEEHYTQRTNVSATKFSTNRELEKEVLKEIQDKLEASAGNPWERTVSLIDVQAEATGSDKTRMRNLLIQLKSSANPAFFNESN